MGVVSQRRPEGTLVERFTARMAAPPTAATQSRISPRRLATWGQLAVGESERQGAPGGVDGHVADRARTARHEVLADLVDTRPGDADREREADRGTTREPGVADESPEPEQGQDSVGGEVPQLAPETVEQIHLSGREPGSGPGQKGAECAPRVRAAELIRGHPENDHHPDRGRQPGRRSHHRLMIQ